jgi:hypothetical protein
LNSNWPARQGLARRNRALRKVRASKHLSPDIKLAIETIVDLLCSKTNYELAWPSAATIAGRYGRRGRRTGQWYVRTIKALGIFTCKQLRPDEAKAFVQERYGYALRLDRCTTYGVNLFMVNAAHPLWDESRKLPEKVDEEMGEIAREIKAKRNAKTTSRLASDPSQRPPRVNGLLPVDDVAKGAEMMSRTTIQMASRTTTEKENFLL